MLVTGNLCDMEPFIENISEVPPAAFFKWKLGQFVFQVDGLNFFPVLIV